MYDGMTNTSRLNREILIRELRDNPPKDWDYSHAETCGLGVAHRLGLLPESQNDPRKWDGKAFLLNIGLSAFNGGWIFFSPVSHCSPAWVANMLEGAPYV